MARRLREFLQHGTVISRIKLSIKAGNVTSMKTMVDLWVEGDGQVR